MARIEDLIDEIANPSLREEIARQVKMLKATKRFGLVFEDHVPETVSLPGLTIRAGLVVQHRRKPEEATRFQVLSVDNGKATIVPVGLDEPVETVPAEDLLVVKAFEEPIFPGLTPVGEVRQGPGEKPAHTVINGENFHTLQLLAYTHAGKVDVIYIDPPYNTGARDWKYNNRFVDNNDAWRHSKWLAMMEKRLKLSRKLLKPDGVLIVTIDEHEVHHLGLLLEDLFPEAYRQMITIVITARGVAKQGMARVEEYAMFVYLGNATASPTSDDLLTDASAKARKPSPWASLLRRGTNARPSDRPGLVYPIHIDTAAHRVTGVGETLLDMVEDGRLARADLNQWTPPPHGSEIAWPTRSNGALGTWQVKPETLINLNQQGYVKLGRHDSSRNSWSINYLKSGPLRQIKNGSLRVTGFEFDGGPAILEYAEETVKQSRAKSVWRRVAHDAGTYGSSLLADFMGSRAFEFPKSLYAVADTLAPVLDKAGVVLDFFAGSGTTLHAVALLNARDGGKRQCILVTNNDVSEPASKRLNETGYFAGDPEFEAEGIFESVTKPRVEAAITGVRPDGTPVEGMYLDQYLSDHSYADGFEENVSFFRMDYLEPDLVELGRQYNVIVPLLWMAAGSLGSWEEWSGSEPWSSPADSTYAVLFDLTEAAAFAEMVESRPEISHVWVVTDSHTAFVEVREELPARVEVGQLYRQYLRNFTVNAPGVLD